MSSAAMTEWVKLWAVKTRRRFLPSQPPLIPGEALLIQFNFIQNIKGSAIFAALLNTNEFC